MTIDDDEFFGDPDNDNNNTGNNNGLAEAETLALHERHRKHGFHETFSSSEQDGLQQGFEQGYLDHVDTAQRIGQRLGALLVMHKRTTSPRDDETSDNEFDNRKSAEGDDTAPPPPHLVAALATRNVLKRTVQDNKGEAEEDGDREQQHRVKARNELNQLESRVEQMYQDATTTNQKPPK